MLNKNCNKNPVNALLIFTKIFVMIVLVNLEKRLC